MATYISNDAWRTRLAALKQARLDRAIGDVSMLAVHELGALSGHWAEIGERLAVARKARSLGELLQDQVDLLPETRARLRQDQQLRRELLQGLYLDLTRNPDANWAARAAA